MSVGEILPNPGTVTTPTITADRTNKIKTWSANELTSAVPIVGTRDGGQHLGELAELLIPPRRERTCPRAVKRARHNSYRVKKPDEPASIRHRAPATINIHRLKPRSAA